MFFWWYHQCPYGQMCVFGGFKETIRLMMMMLLVVTFLQAPPFHHFFHSYYHIQKIETSLCYVNFFLCKKYMKFITIIVIKVYSFKPKLMMFMRNLKKIKEAKKRIKFQEFSLIFVFFLFVRNFQIPEWLFYFIFFSSLEEKLNDLEIN